MLELRLLILCRVAMHGKYSTGLCMISGLLNSIVKACVGILFGGRSINLVYEVTNLWGG